MAFWESWFGPAHHLKLVGEVSPVFSLRRVVAEAGIPQWSCAPLSLAQLRGRRPQSHRKVPPFDSQELPVTLPQSSVLAVLVGWLRFLDVAEVLPGIVAVVASYDLHFDVVVELALDVAGLVGVLAADWPDWLVLFV